MKYQVIPCRIRGWVLAFALLSITAFAQSRSPTAVGADPATSNAVDTVAGSWRVTNNPANVAGAQFQGFAGANTPVSITVTLKLDNAALDSYIAAQNTPGNPAYHHFLSSAQSTQKFSPTVAQAQAVADYLTQQGFTQVQIAANRLLVTAIGTVAQAQQAFHTEIGRYILNGESGFANTTAILVPARLSQVDGVLGLDTLNKAHTYQMQPTMHPVPMPAPVQP